MAIGFLVIGPDSVDRTIAAMKVIGPDAMDRTIVEGWVIDMNGDDQLFFDPSGSASLEASASPDLVSAYGTAGSMTTDTTIVTPTGGTGPYTYAWTLISYDAGVPPTATSPATASTEFTQTGIGPADAFSAVWSCTVTDANLNTAAANVTAFWQDIT